MLFVFVKMQAQNYTISFAGSGASTTVDSLKVENLSQSTSLIMAGGDQLNLVENITGVNPGMPADDNIPRIFPNPSNGELDLTFESNANAESNIEIFNVHGRLMAKSKFTLNSGHQNFHICGLNSGIYTVLIKTEGSLYTGKIISQSSGGKAIKITNTNGTIRHESNMPLKNNQAIVQMQYNNGDLLKFTGKSGIYATVNMAVPTSSQTMNFYFVACTDMDNNNYAVVQIGSKIWMAENLKTTKFSSGEEIPEVTDASQWQSLSTGAFCYFNNDPGNAIIYGCLYNWYAAIDNRNACPANWHVPTDDEWISLTSFLGGEAVAGGKMKETGILHWFSPNTGATNESGFTIIAGGCRIYGNFDFMGYGGSFWSITPFNDIFAWNRDIFYYNTVANRSGSDKKNGLSVRCVKD